MSALRKSLYVESRSALVAEIERIAVLLDVCERPRVSAWAPVIEPMTVDALESGAHWLSDIFSDVSDGAAGNDGPTARDLAREAFDDVDRHLSITLLGSGASDRGAVAVNAFRSMTRPEQRGRCRGSHARAVLYGLGYVGTDSRETSVETAYALMGNGWVNVDAHSRRTPVEQAFNKRADYLIQLAALVQACRAEQWRVVLGFNGGPRVSFATDPTSAHQMFALRDIAAGKTRRDTLLH